MTVIVIVNVTVVLIVMPVAITVVIIVRANGHACDGYCYDHSCGYGSACYDYCYVPYMCVVLCKLRLW